MSLAGETSDLDVITVKVLVVGPYNAGKTSLISTMSEVPVVTTETAPSLPDDSGATTTVALDFGVVSVRAEDTRIEMCLFGTPGQDRFSFFWEILAKNMLGFVLMVDTRDEATWDTARQILGFFSGLAAVPFVVGANRASDGDSTLARLRQHLDLDDDVPVVACEAVDRRSAARVVVTLLRVALDRTLGHHRAAGPSR